MDVLTTGPGSCLTELAGELPRAEQEALDSATYLGSVAGVGVEQGEAGEGAGQDSLPSSTPYLQANCRKLML